LADEGWGRGAYHAHLLACLCGRVHACLLGGGPPCPSEARGLHDDEARRLKRAVADAEETCERLRARLRATDERTAAAANSEVVRHGRRCRLLFNLSPFLGDGRAAGGEAKMCKANLKHATSVLAWCRCRLRSASKP
jgi:hypothetical protein